MFSILESYSILQRVATGFELPSGYLGQSMLGIPFPFCVFFYNQMKCAACIQKFSKIVE